MKTILAVLIIVMSFSTSSCTVIGTLYPVTDESKDFGSKNELIGKWWEDGDSSGYFSIDTLTGYNGVYFKIYAIEADVESKIEDTISFRGILTNIDGWYFFEYWHTMKKGTGGFAVPRHFVMRLSFPGNDKIEFSSIDADELLTLIDQKKIHLTYAKQLVNLGYKMEVYKEYDYLILDKTQVLRKALRETKKYPKVYEEKITLTRMQGSLF